jgi:8-oxo-dGTP pyrophosphatase MutT (NUDIX family)
MDPQTGSPAIPSGEFEVTRHFTATTYVVRENATLLHRHPGLDTWLPPGGHIDRDELPHRAALREVSEETGLDAELVAERDDIESDTVEPLPKPRHVQLADVNACGDEVGHQHVDLVYYARAGSRAIDPDDGEVPAADWEWFAPSELRSDDRLDPDVREIGLRAIDAVGEDSTS